MPKPLLKDEDLTDLPWEDEDGNVRENLDGGKLRKFVLGLMNDKIRAQNSRDLTKAERDEFETKVSDLEASGLDPAKLDQTVKDLNAKNKALEKQLSEPSAREIRLEVALEKGLTLKQANRLVGKDRDELLEDADEYLSEVKPKDSKKDDEDDDGKDPEVPPLPTRRPGGNRQNGFTPPPSGADELPDIDFTRL